MEDKTTAGRGCSVLSGFLSLPPCARLGHLRAPCPRRVPSPESGSAWLYLSMSWLSQTQPWKAEWSGPLKDSSPKRSAIRHGLPTEQLTLESLESSEHNAPEICMDQVHDHLEINAIQRLTEVSNATSATKQKQDVGTCEPSASLFTKGRGLTFTSARVLVRAHVDGHSCSPTQKTETMRSALVPTLTV